MYFKNVISVAKICKYGIFVAEIYKYAFNDSFLRFSGSLDSAASLAALVGGGGGGIRAMSERKHSFLKEVFPN